MSISSALAESASKLVGFGVALTKSLFGQDTSSYVRPGRPSKLKKETTIEQKSPSEMLGMIFGLMQKTKEEDKKEKLEQNKLDDKKRQREIVRTEALIKALSVKRKPVKKQIKEKKAKKEEEKPKVTPPEQTKPTPTAPAPTTPAPTAPAPTAPAPAAPKPTAPAPVKPAPTAPTATKLPSPTAITGVVAAGGLATLSASVIAKEEGLPKGGKAYWDPPGQNNLVSIGYGHQIKPEEYKQGFIQSGDEQITIKGEKGIDTVMTSAQAKKLLEIDVPKYEKRAKDPLGDSWNKLNDNQKAALTSYAYNTGSTSSLVRAGLKEAIDSGNMYEAARIIREKGIKTSQGKYLKALDDRRQKEASLFESSITQKPIVPISTPTTETGSVIDTSSKQNKELKNTLKEKQTPVSTTTNIMATEEPTEEDSMVERNVDDRNIYLKKSRK